MLLKSCIAIAFLAGGMWGAGCMLYWLYCAGVVAFKRPQKKRPQVGAQGRAVKTRSRG